MHTPTWFSNSVEFKESDLRSAKKKGWHGWQRERSDARRKQRRPEENLQTETVIGFRPDQFLRYVELERVASGLDCGERLHLSDRIEKSLVGGEILLPASRRHPLELQLGLPASDILDIISGAFRLAAAVRGGVAEHHLHRYLREVPGVQHIRHIIEDGQRLISKRPVRLRPILAAVTTKRHSSMCSRRVCTRSRQNGSSDSRRQIHLRRTRSA